MNQTEELKNSILMSDLNVCLDLLESGAYVNCTYSDGDTPLHLASRYGTQEICSALLSSGACLDEVNHAACTALHAAVMGNAGADLVRLLIERGAQIDAIDGSGETPLHYAARNGRIDLCELLVSKGANINIISDSECTPLVEAAMSGHVRSFLLLINLGADASQLPLIFGGSKSTRHEYCKQAFHVWQTGQCAPKSERAFHK